MRAEAKDALSLSLLAFITKEISLHAGSSIARGIRRSSRGYCDPRPFSGCRTSSLNRTPPGGKLTSCFAKG